MARRRTRTVSFTALQESFVSDCVESGRYQSASEVVREALRLLQDREEHREAELARVRALVAEGAVQIDRGEVVDAEDVFARLEEKHRRRKAECDRDR